MQPVKFMETLGLISKGFKLGKSFLLGKPLLEAIHLLNNFDDLLVPLYRAKNYSLDDINKVQKVLNDFSTGNYVQVTKQGLHPELLEEFQAGKNNDPAARTIVPFYTQSYGNPLFSSILNNAVEGNGLRILTVGTKPYLFASTIGYSNRGFHDPKTLFYDPTFKTATGSIFTTDDLIKDFYYTPMTSERETALKIKNTKEYLKHLGLDDWYTTAVLPKVQELLYLLSKNSVKGDRYMYTNLDANLINGNRADDISRIIELLEELSALESEMPGLFTGMTNVSFLLPSVKTNLVGRSGFLDIVFDPGFKNVATDLKGAIIKADPYLYTSLPKKTIPKMWDVEKSSYTTLLDFKRRLDKIGTTLNTNDLGRLITGPQIGHVINVIDANPYYKDKWNTTDSFILGDGILVFKKRFKDGGSIDYSYLLNNNLLMKK